jgi:cytoskeletal protein RodZ
MPKTISTHITALLTGAAGVIALVHPGFVVPPFVQGLVTAICGILAAVVEIFHVASKNTLAVNLAAAAAVAQRVNAAAANTTTSSTTTTTTTTPADPAAAAPAPVTPDPNAATASAQ